MSSSLPISNYLIGHNDLVALSEERAKELSRQIGNDLDTVLQGIGAIGTMLASIDPDDMGNRHVLPAGMLVDYLADLAWHLENTAQGCRMEFRDAVMQDRQRQGAADPKSAVRRVGVTRG